MKRVVNGSLRRQSSKGAPPVGTSLSSSSNASLQRPAGRLSTTIKPRAVMPRPSSVTRTAADTTFTKDTQRPSGRLLLPANPRTVPVRPIAASQTAAGTKFAKEAPVGTSITPKGAQQPKIGSTSGASKSARGMPSAPAGAKRLAARPTPAVPVVHRPLGPAKGLTGASRRSLQRVGEASAGSPRGSASRLSAASSAPQPLLYGARRSVAAVPRAAGSQPVPGQPEAKTGLAAGPAVQPPPRSRLRPPTSTCGRKISD
ncbi:uncharacterized protein [Dermacentor andersoni]|uniref:uncharacterized protein n=1 Tax=Dermacentor andersoni TaxID=34620 RepID=UPI003B3B6790